MLESEKYWNIASVYEDKTRHFKLFNNMGTGQKRNSK
jgi:hypothetical protein